MPTAARRIQRRRRSPPMVAAAAAAVAAAAVCRREAARRAGQHHLRLGRSRPARGSIVQSRFFPPAFPLFVLGCNAAIERSRAAVVRASVFASGAAGADRHAELRCWEGEPSRAAPCQPPRRRSAKPMNLSRAVSTFSSLINEAEADRALSASAFAWASSALPSRPLHTVLSVCRMRACTTA